MLYISESLIILKVLKLNREFTSCADVQPDQVCHICMFLEYSQFFNGITKISFASSVYTLKLIISWLTYFH